MTQQNTGNEEFVIEALDYAMAQGDVGGLTFNQVVVESRLSQKEAKRALAKLQSANVVTFDSEEKLYRLTEGYKKSLFDLKGGL